MKFLSKKDSWVIWFLTAVFGFVIASVYILPEKSEIPIWVNIVVVASLGLIYWMYVGTYTVVENNILTHRAGPIKWSVPVEKIKKVKLKSTHPINHGTWSTDKMDIIHERGTLSIAPNDKNELIDFLQKINSNIEIEE